MMIRKKEFIEKGFIKSTHVSSLYKPPLYKITKIGYITNNSLSYDRSYYRVICNDDACNVCLQHNGAIYPFRENGHDPNHPPYHPNCKCTTAVYQIDPFTSDPLAQETNLWLYIMFESDSNKQKAQALLNFYKYNFENLDIDTNDLLNWVRLSINAIANILSNVSQISNIIKRREAFFSELKRFDPRVPIRITPETLEEFGWMNPTKEEANQIMDAFATYGITSRESAIQFLALAAAESGYGENFLEIGSKEYFMRNGYTENTRGAGYLQVTHDYNHQDFLNYIESDYDEEDTATFIAENFPLEVSTWFWTKIDLYGWNERAYDEFINTKLEEGGDPFLIFVKSAYYLAGMPDKEIFPHFNDDINEAIERKTDATFEVIDDLPYIVINGRAYELPSRWEARKEAYKKAQKVW